VKTAEISMQIDSIGVSESLGRAATALRRAEAWKSVSTTDVASLEDPIERCPNPVTTTVPKGGIETAEFELAWTTKIASSTMTANATTVEMEFLHDR
jgi:hypothetical protein